MTVKYPDEVDVAAFFAGQGFPGAIMAGDDKLPSLYGLCRERAGCLRIRFSQKSRLKTIL
jgi:hypothetical protein